MIDDLNLQAEFMSLNDLKRSQRSNVYMKIFSTHLYFFSLQLLDSRI